MSRLVPDPEVPGAYYVRINRTDHSWIDPDEPTRLEFDYMQRIADALDVHRPEGERMRVVHIGGAGMSLARYVAVSRPTSPQIVLEPDASLTEEVRQAAPLPRNSGIKVRATDGRTGIAAMPGEYADVIILDAFAEASVPADVTTVEFFTDISRVLAADGMLLVNVTDRGPLHYTRRVMAGLAQIFPETLLEAEPATLKGRRFGNLIALAARATPPVQALTRRAAASPFPYRVLYGTELRRFVGGAAAYTDQDCEPSPPPPVGDTVFS
ncbi:spermidine synthase [Granulicoccus phenolivorans]|uniref:spermidine synthase n=1 Tax=Granulicoccus phenolivorans TaxID=266854 RepID=UPI00040227B5|nr:fused MFS/spermidine synthase [Granulicoccus phenolivorans]